MVRFEKVLHLTLALHLVALVILALLWIGHGVDWWAVAWWVFPALALVGAAPFIVAAWMALMAMTYW